MPASIPVGYVRISTSDPPLRVYARLSDEQVKVDQGYGGWEEVARPRRSPLTSWVGSPAIHLTLPILLDQFAEQKSVEKEISDLMLMGRPSASDGEPPQVSIGARGAAIPYQARKWIVSDLQFGDAVMNYAGNRCRAKITLSLTEYIEDVYLVERGAANRQRVKAAQSKPSKGAPKKRVYTGGKPPGSSKKTLGVGEQKTGLTSSYPFGSGETLVRVAARELGDATRWPELADLNGLRDPRAVPFGKVIRLP